MSDVSFEAFKAFCASKGNERYSYIDNTNCAFAQYLKSCGHPYPNVGGDDYNLDHRISSFNQPNYLMSDICDRKYGDLDFSEIICGERLSIEYHGQTFDMLLKRLELLK